MPPLTGVKVRLAMLAVVITWPAVTATPLSFSVPVAGRVTMVTDCSVSAERGR